MGKRLPDESAATELAQIENVGDRDIISSVDGGPAIDTLMTTIAAPIRSVLVQIPLQLLDCGEAYVIEQLPAKRFDGPFQYAIQRREARRQATLIHFKHAELALDLPSKLGGTVVHHCRGSAFQFADGRRQSPHCPSRVDVPAVVGAQRRGVSGHPGVKPSQMRHQRNH